MGGGNRFGPGICCGRKEGAVFLYVEGGKGEGAVGYSEGRVQMKGIGV